MKDNNGSWSYRRRVPKRHHKTLRLEVWNKPCGKVSYAEAVSKVVEWTKEHTRLIESLVNPSPKSEVRRDTETHQMEPKLSVLIIAQQANVMPSSFDPLQAAVAGLKAVDENPKFDAHDRLVRYRGILETSFGDHIVPPKAVDKREYFDLIKRKLERRIVDIDGDPNTISAVSERAFEFSQIKPQVRDKYRRNIRMLINYTGDIPLIHLTASQLREFRESKSDLKSSAVSSLFTPIKTMMRHAVENEIIPDNPMRNVSMPRETRSLD